MDWYIYITTNLINGKQYIGQHKGSPDDSYLGSGVILRKAIKTYGKENFSKNILCYCTTQEEADEKEKYYIKLYNAVENPNFYNLIEGGQNGNGWKACHRWMKEHPEEVRKNLVKLNAARDKWREEHPEECQAQIDRWRKSGPIANSKKIHCITTNKIFNSISEAARYYNIPQSNISKCLKSERHSAGKDPITGQKMYWELAEK